MKDPQDLQCISQEQIDSHQNQIDSILKSINKNQINSIKGMILPPMFTFNVLKIVLMIQDPKITQEDITWIKIKKDLLVSVDIFQRRFQKGNICDLDIDEIDKLQKVYQETFKSFGNNIQSKSELYGTLIHKLCRFCLISRIIMHGSKFLRSQD